MQGIVDKSYYFNIQEFWGFSLVGSVGTIDTECWWKLQE
jgi:hypothetical protein